ncbi:MAG: UPF0175 family protein [Phycisphaerae bacterium]|nr:UPF0175 family protein [Phycisphaerae bacterium]
MIQIQLPEDVESRLRGALGDLDSVAKEAALVELFRQGHVTHYELSEALGLSRFETDAMLKHHHVTDDLSTAEEYAAELQTARRVMDR